MKRVGPLGYWSNFSSLVASFLTVWRSLETWSDLCTVSRSNLRDPMRQTHKSSQSRVHKGKLGLGGHMWPVKLFVFN